MQFSGFLLGLGRLRFVGIGEIDWGIRGAAMVACAASASVYAGASTTLGVITGGSVVARGASGAAPGAVFCSCSSSSSSSEAWIGFRQHGALRSDGVGSIRGLASGVFARRFRVHVAGQRMGSSSRTGARSAGVPRADVAAGEKRSGTAGLIGPQFSCCVRGSEID